MNLSSFFQTERLTVTKRVTFLVAIFLSVFFIIDVYRKLPQLYLVELIVLFCAIILLFKFDHWITKKTIDVYAVVFTNLLFCLILYSITVHGLENSSYLWVISIPMGAYMLTGLKWGFRLTAIYLIIAVVIIYSKNTIVSNSFKSIADSTDFIFLVITLWVLTHSYERSNKFSQQSWATMALQDQLTTLSNRHAFYNLFQENCDKVISLMIIDLDWFKIINDTYGHDAGDAALKDVAEILKLFESDSSQAFRLGGEEFAILFIAATPLQVIDKGKEVLYAIRNHKIYYDDYIIELTASIGLALCESSTCDLSDLIREADKHLYVAKKKGRDQLRYDDSYLPTEIKKPIK